MVPNLFWSVDPLEDRSRARGPPVTRLNRIFVSRKFLSEINESEVHMIISSFDSTTFWETMQFGNLIRQMQSPRLELSLLRGAPVGGRPGYPRNYLLEPGRCHSEGISKIVSHATITRSNSRDARFERITCRPPAIEHEGKGSMQTCSLI